MANWFEKLPSVNDLVETGPLKNLFDSVGRQRVVTETARFLNRVRSEAQSAAQRIMPISPVEFAQRVARWITTSGAHAPQEVLNATGTFFSTELATAPLPTEVADALAGTTQGWQGNEGWGSVVADLLRRQLNADNALVFVSGSAALAAVATALPDSQTVVLARGELERDPFEPSLADFAGVTGIRLHEVGSVNATTLSDYEASLTNAGLLLSSSLRWSHVAGNNERPTPAQLIQLGRRMGVPSLFDLGWQGIYDVLPLGWSDSLSAKELIAQGAELILLRGNGLLGGPPCGILMGKSALIDKVAAHALTRITTASQLTQSALAATLKLYEHTSTAEMSIPVVSLLATSEENLKQRAERLAPQIAACRGIQSAESLSTPAWLHSGQPLEQALPSWGIRVLPSIGNLDELASHLRRSAPGIVGVKTDAGLVLNLRTVLPKDDLQLVMTFENLFPGDTQ